MGSNLGYGKLSGQIPHYGFPVLTNAQAEQADTAAIYEPGMIVAVKNGNNWSLAMYGQADATGFSQGEVAVFNPATLNQYSMAAAAATDAGGPIKGIAAATIAAAKFGWFYIQGYVEKADLSHTAASGEYLMISGSTAAKLTPNKASVFNAGTQGSSTMFLVVAVARTAIATGVGSVSIVGCWG